MNKDVLKAITDFATTKPEKVLKMMLDNGVGIEIVERKIEDYESSGTLYFKANGSYFSIPFCNYSYGEGEYTFSKIKEVQPKTKQVTYFE